MGHTPETRASSDGSGGWVIPEAVQARMAGNEPSGQLASEAGAAEKHQLPSYAQPEEFRSTSHRVGPDHAGSPTPVPALALSAYAPPVGAPAPGLAPPSAYQGSPATAGYPAQISPAGYPAQPYAGFTSGAAVPWLTAQPVRPTSKTRRRVTMTAIAAVVALVLTGVIAAIHPYGLLSGDHQVRLPTASGDYTRLHSTTSDRLSTQLSTGFGGVMKRNDMAEWSDPVAGAYGNVSSATPQLVFIGASNAHNAFVSRHIKASSMRTFIDGLVQGAQLTRDLDVPAGRFGGLLHCGLGSQPGISTVCVWVDSSTMGLMLFLDGSTVDAAASAALAFRGAAEH